MLLQTSLLVDTTHGGLGKILNKRYLSKGQEDYNSKVNKLLDGRVWIKGNKHKRNSNSKGIQFITKLSEPFNPATTIKYG